jgi:predicted RNA-binding protein YlqC (UPF0109 family)
MSDDAEPFEDDDDVDEHENANLIDGDDLDDDDLEDDDDLDDDVDDDVDDVNRIPAANARAVLEYLAKAMVDDPDSVEVETGEGRGRAVSLSVQVAPGDMGRVIGKRGRIANSIRTVVRAAAVRDGVDVDVDFVD